MRRATSFFFLATMFSVTFEKVHWSVAGAVAISDVLAILFLLSFAILSRPRLPVTSAIVLVFFAAFLVVYLSGFFNLETHQQLAQFVKGFVKFLIHFSFLAAGVAWLARRGQAYFWRTLAWFCGGIAVNAAYGIVQLLAARSGLNLDSVFVSPLTGGASQINIYGAVEGAKVYRSNALTGDPNHLGIMLIIPLLVLTPLYLRLERGHRLKTRLGLLIAFLFVAELSTLSRSGLLGLTVGAIVLALPYRHHLLSKALLYPLAGVVAVLGVVVLTRLHFFTVVIRSRLQTGGGSVSTHLEIYDFVPRIIHSHPVLGLGLNTFSLYYELATGKTNWGPHSFYVALIVETGIAGTALFVAFLYWVFRRLHRARAIGRALTAAGDPLARRVRPLAWGFTAALAGTIAANAFYLTMQFYYFYAFLALALALPLVFARSAGTTRS